ncbi:hypothetical protein LUZ61_000179 [Rhynchospora tenuis]|uniref:KIB1-4 beta-propeller domain-containing protein n=1 Tax=Rhynchospora tenuis TaxID=198213 RepID=A0AAD6EPK0_9POAL|nr:hypothetical protein LUZ61_000179 [Rhynchospora tenuis]
MATSEKEEERDWSELPPELIHVIAKKVPDLVDFIRFRAACKTWRSSAPLSDPPDQLPWLLELYYPCSLRRRQRYYSVSSGKTLMIPFTRRKLKLRSWIRRGVSSHYLAFNDEYHTVSFFNPLTKSWFSLPPMRRCLHYGTPWMVWTGTDPIRDRCIVVVDRNRTLYNEIGGWFFLDPHNNEWVEQEGYFFSTCYWQGMIFSTHKGWPTKVFDAYSKELLHDIPPPENEVLKDLYVKGDLHWNLRKSYLIVSSGVILRVSWYNDRDRNIIEESVFHIYRLDFETADDKPCWVRVADIGDQILFLEEMNGFSITARPSTGFRKGCIYFIDPEENKPYIHDVLAGTVERLPCPFKKCTWFLPGL